jgi:lipoyl(octanoyl) transferase
MQAETRHLGRVDYLPTYEAMQAFTAARHPMGATEGLQDSLAEPDQLWICEHPPVYTQGLAGKVDHVLNPGAIPVVQTNRGGQVTYHGPGQVVAYPLIDLKRAGYYVKEYVYRIEESVIKTLAHFGVTGHRVAGSPGIYVRLDDPASHAVLSGPHAPPLRGSLPPVGADSPWGGPAANPGPLNPADPFRGLGKIAALGIKVSRHCTYHGVALNVAMDLEPFSRINPCGYVGLQTTDLSTIGVSASWQEAADVLGRKLVTYLAP